tara:strand:+ start:937 stop:1563 length:627 start_codon:yes stop_codon:yes gene_type:complete
MVLPIISSLASVSSSISLISSGLTSISSLIGGLGSALAGAFSTGLVAFENFKTQVDSFFSSLEDKGKDALGSVSSALAGGYASPTLSFDPKNVAGGGSGPRKPASAYIPGYVAPTPTAAFDSPRKSFADMETRHPLAGLNDTLDGLRYLIENEGGLVQAINRKAGETNVTVNVHGGAMERRAAMAVGNIIAEEANRKTGTQQRATRYL